MSSSNISADQVADRMAIVERLNSCEWGYDSRDPALLREGFTPDASLSMYRQGSRE